MTNNRPAAPRAAEDHNQDDIARWRVSFLERALKYSLPFGAIAAAPPLWMAVQAKAWILVAVVLVALSSIAALWRARSLPYTLRAAGLLGVMLAVGAFAAIRVGLGGLIYLAVLPLIAALLLGFWPAVAALALDGLVLLAIGVLAPMGEVAQPLASVPTVRWISFSITFFTVSGVFTLFLAQMMRRLEDSLQRHQQANARLVQEAAARQEAEAALLRLNAGLEDRVQQRTAQLRAAIAELESFSYAVSHDLRAPLGTIDGFSGALQRQLPDDGPQQHYISRVRAATRQMSELIDAMLLLAQVSRGSLVWEQVDLSALAEELAQALREQHTDRFVAVEVQPGMSASGDARLLRQLLDNLLGNAWKFTAGQPQARVSFSRSVGPDGEDVYAVRDNGVGFDMAFASHLFSAFHRMHRPEEFGGNGIGLATAQKIVQRHGGRIWADAHPGEGAAFFFTLGTSPKPGPPKS